MRRKASYILWEKHIVVPISNDLINFFMLDDPIITQKTLENKLYQLIISRLDGESIYLTSYQKKIFKLVENGIGGFIIFGGKRDKVKYFIHKIQSISEIPLFIASDIERGVGQQIQDCTIFPCQMAVSAAINRNRLEEVIILMNAIAAIADEAKDVGINMPLIPVLDVNKDPDNPIICTRAFSDNPEAVSWFGSEYIKTLERSGLVSCAKHFPGHGDTSIDSHISLPVINKSYKDLADTDMKPFKEAIRSGVSSIMIGHLSIPAINSKPASLSKKIITHILRKELRFDGLIVTDALTMHALKDIGNVPLQCLKAGADILLHPVDPDLTVKELIYAIESKEITEEQIEEAINRILKAKEKLADRERREVDYYMHEMLSVHITDISITLFKSTPKILPIHDPDKVYVFLAGDNELFQSSPLKRYFQNVFMINDAKRIMSSNLPLSHSTKEGLTTPLIPLNKGGMGVVKGGEGGLLDATIIFAIFTSVAAWKGSSGIDEDEKFRIQSLIQEAKHSIVISFGSPYVLRHFKEADVLIAAYETTENAQNAVIKCLEGRMDFKGRFPVKIDI